MFPLFRPRGASTPSAARSGSRFLVRLNVDELEARQMLSNAPLVQPPLVQATNPSTYGYTPAQMRHAYGFDQLSQDGSGQTIAIVDAYYDPNITADLHAFDQNFGLRDPILTQVDQNGGTNFPGNNALWGEETYLDVEWAHAIAPGANILLVEANTNSTTDLLAAVDTARNYPGVSAVSMSWATGEFAGETTLDGHFTTPAGHGGVTFLSSAGDEGAQAEWPAVAPNVVAVGGTSLPLGGGGNYVSETAWSSGGGSISVYEAKPGYQNGRTPGGKRAAPDVAYDSDPSTGFAVYDSDLNNTGNNWFALAGTSAAAPQWAGLVTLANQGRAQHGLGALDGASQTLPLLYSLPCNAFHDVTSGGNSNVATPGYDLITGRGSPIANVLVPYLWGATSLVATTVDKNNDTVLLWDRADGSAVFWTMDNSFHLLSSNSFAVAGWTAVKVAAGGDGLTRVLWVNNATGAAELWLLNSNDTVAATAPAPFAIAGWNVVDMAVGSGPNSQTRLLWSNGSSGQVVVWTVDHGFNVVSPQVFGPISGWSVRALGVSPADLSWLLWDNGGTGQAALWELNSNNTLNQGAGYGPYNGWIATDVTAGGDGNARLLWQCNDGRMGVWTISSSTLATTASGFFGPASGFTAVALAGGRDGLTRLIWTGSEGVQVLWLLNPDDSYNSEGDFGPY